MTLLKVTEISKPSLEMPLNIPSYIYIGPGWNQILGPVFKLSIFAALHICVFLRFFFFFFFVFPALLLSLLALV